MARDQEIAISTSIKQTVETLGFIANHPLNKRRMLRGLDGYLKWQIGARLVPGPVVYEWVSGARMIVRRGEQGVTQNIYCGLQDFGDMAYLLHVMTDHDLFIDVGANVGAYTVLACAARGARGYCFEPVPSTYSRLLDNIAINNLSARVNALNLGLADGDGELSFTTGENCTNHVTASDEQSVNTIKVPVRTLDSVLIHESPTMMKIDVEGFETPIIDGAEATLAKPSLHSVVMELNGSGRRYGFDEDSILRKMSDHGFSTYEYEPFSRTLRSLNGKKNTYGNTLFLRNESYLRERIGQAQRISIGGQEF